jgi:hypothetical protein
MAVAQQPTAFTAHLGERAAVRVGHFLDPRWTGRR